VIGKGARRPELDPESLSSAQFDKLLGPPAGEDGGNDPEAIEAAHRELAAGPALIGANLTFGASNPARCAASGTEPKLADVLVVLGEIKAIRASLEGPVNAIESKSEYQFEAGNVRHEHEWKVWKDVKVPDDRVLIPGVISHVINVVEHAELIAERLLRFAGVVGGELIMAGSDCGFAQGPFTRRVHPSIQWAKLRAQAEGARLATAKLWGKSSADV
jgi:hypothetical protein